MTGKVCHAGFYRAAKDAGIPHIGFSHSLLGVSFGELSDDHAKWEARLRSWRKSAFWLPLWGAKPGEAGCIVPPALLTGGLRAGQ